MNVKQIPLIIPSLEPDEKLPRLLAQLRQAGIENIVLVDDGSGPAYHHFFDEAEQQGCTVLRHAVNLGKGRALKDAFNCSPGRMPLAVSPPTRMASTPPRAFSSVCRRCWTIPTA